MLNFKRAHIALTALALLVVSVMSPVAAWAGDPTGASIGKDTYTALFGDATNEEAIAKVAVGLNFVWILIAGFLVIFMKTGFAMLETGFCRAQNAASVILNNLGVFFISIMSFFAIGFALMFGGAAGISALGGTSPLNGTFQLAENWGLFGTKGFFLTSGGAYDVGVYALFMFQVAFLAAAVTITSGAVAERIKFSAFAIYAVFMSILIYPIFGNWVWGGGWLSKLGLSLGLGNGFVDFAGSTVVHFTGGLAALAGAAVLGARIGKFTEDGEPMAIPGHNIPMGILGALILLFGWFGFNAGSTLSGIDLRMSVVALNTLLGACFGALSATIFTWVRFGRPDPTITANGALGGLVAITGPGAFVGAISASTIGFIGGAIVFYGVLFVERRLKIDDPVGAIAVHAGCGLWGTLALGIFADGTYGAGLNGISSPVTGLLYGGYGQFLVQIIGAAVCFIYVFGMMYGFFRLLDKVMGIRVPEEVELSGLDIDQTGILAYPERKGLGISYITATERGSAQ